MNRSARCAAAAAIAFAASTAHADPPAPPPAPVAAAPDAVVDCDQGIYLEPSVLLGVGWNGQRLDGLRNALGLELHNCDAHGHWTRAYRVGVTGTLGGARANNSGGTIGAEAELELALYDTQRVGVRLGYNDGLNATYSLTAGGRYHVGDVAFGVDLIAFTHGADAIPKGVLGSITVGGKAGRYSLAVEAGIALLVFLTAFSSYNGR